MKRNVIGILVLAVLVMVGTNFNAMIFGQAKAAAEKEVRITDEEAKAGQDFDTVIKQAEQVLNGTLSGAVQSTFDTQSALEVLGKIQTAFLRLENLRLRKLGWEKDVQFAHNCAGCVVDLATKTLRARKPEAAQRE